MFAASGTFLWTISNVNISFKRSHKSMNANFCGFEAKLCFPSRVNAPNGIL